MQRTIIVIAALALSACAAPGYEQYLADMISVGVALGVHVQTNFAKGQALRAQIDAATTKEDVEAVVW